jgi:capsid assembly protease
MRALQAVMSRPWAIQREALQTIVEIAARVNHPEALSAQYDPRMGDARYTEVRGGVAILNVEGPIARYMNLFSYFSGGTSSEILAKEFTAAFNDPSVKAILLHINSPGGAVDGISELAGMIYEARESGAKPITAYVSGAGCSGAYWLASAAEEIVLGKTAYAGSIGVVMSFTDYSKAYEMRGIQEVEIVSSNAPNKRPDHRTDEGRALIQKFLDDTEDVFLSEVARNRGVSVETVLSDYGRGGIMVGAEAVKAGLADRIGTFEGVMAELAGRAEGRNGTLRIAASGTGEGGKEKITTMSVWKKIFGGLSPEERQEVAASLAGEGEANEGEAPQTGGAAVAQVTASLVGVVDPEKDALRAEVERQRGELLQRDAEAFADRFKDRITPDQRPGVIQEYLRAASDDRTMPLAQAGEGAAPTRVAALEARFASLPPHRLTDEVLRTDATDGVQVLTARAKTEGMGDGTPEPERKNTLLSLTPLGQEVIKANGNGKGA